ncbi:MAG: ROK family transcriptional regulator [Armatimonadota bacterium]|nr:ROK family transcriptional regulator [bacterium]
MNTKETTTRGLDASVIRRSNRKAVLDVLRSREPVGRREIAELTRLSVPTISRVTAELAEQSIIREVGSVNIGKAKRKTALLDINPEAGWVVGMEVGGAHIRATAIDLKGELHESVESSMENVRGEEPVAEAIQSVLKKIITTCEPMRGRPLSIGVSSAGVVDSGAGIVTLSFNLQVQNFHVAKIVRDVCDVPVAVDNNITAPTLAEARLGHGRHHSSFAYLSIGMGIGAGYVLDGQVQHLSPHAEFGLMVVAPEGDPERFGGRGYLESLASGRGIAASARRAMESGEKTLISDLTPEGPASVTAKIVAQAARQNDELALKIMARAAEYLGIGIVNIAHTLGLTTFFINGGVPRSGEPFWKPLRESIERHEYWPGEIQLEESLLSDDAAVIGAGLLGLEKAFERLVANGDSNP